MLSTLRKSLQATSDNHCKKDNISLFYVNDRTMNENFKNNFLIFKGI